MISHTTLGTNNLEKAEAFYDQLLPLLGGTKVMKTDRVIFFSFKNHEAKLAISKPFDGEPATNGNGTMVAFSAESDETVSAVYAKAISLGATDEGAPGPRLDGLYFGAYFRDLDGNKLAVFHRPA
ncbi:VOC family protein [Microbulbifer zhoushanensis]|uniref:VOC family protein n=1 Tax=Microbulbifer TaxID=48073 RepID=UPI001F3D223E|nr:VOC family protein [Microbulbifer zhoushanensis]